MEKVTGKAPVTMENSEALRSIPSIDAVLKHHAVAAKIHECGRDLAAYAARETIDIVRRGLSGGKPPPTLDSVSGMVLMAVDAIRRGSLRPIINATGIVLHTNLGRAVLGKKVLDDIAPIVLGYSTIEFDCAKAARGGRHDHIAGLLKYLTHAENAIVVNNNAAAIVLALGALARKKEVIVSRGELIEIGGEFRIPEIMAASGARMVEVGTTNRTRIADYEKAITERTAVLFKAHKSNFSMNGFVEEATVQELSRLARKHGLLVVHDIGSGLVRKPKGLPLDNEPDVASSIDNGADLVLFSADKLLGGPQAGIIAGRNDLIALLAKAPLMRALRVGKLTLAALVSACRHYLDDKQLVAENPTFFMLSRGRDDLRHIAETLRDALMDKNIKSDVVENQGQCGGGTLPDVNLQGFAVRLQFPGTIKSRQAIMAESVFKRLLAQDPPILGILREGSLLFDLRTVDDQDVPFLAEAISREINESHRELKG
jgi:L-seryl-tRNA(Ser) seleniumtransferase